MKPEDSSGLQARLDKKYDTSRPMPDNLNERTWGIPYSGDSSYGLAAALQGVGIPAEVMEETCTEHTYGLAEKNVITQTCEPFRILIGDALAWLEKKSEKHGQDELALFQPTAEGPCRQGQYTQVMRLILDSNGYEGVPIVSPSGKTNYSELDLPPDQRDDLVKLAFKSIFALDILYNALLRIRPYEKKPEVGNTAGELKYKELLGHLCDEIRSGGHGLEDAMYTAAAEMSKVDFDRSRRFPIALVNGEFFMRLHPGANHYISKLLEGSFSRPLETLVASTAEWFLYVNSWNYQDAKQAMSLRHPSSLIDVFKKGINRWYMNKQKDILWMPFEDLLRGREIHDAYDYSKKAEDRGIFHTAIEGESPITVGTTYLFIEGHFRPVGDAAISGICHVGPWQCMHETVATSVSQALIRNARERAGSAADKILPYVDLAFSDAPEPQMMPKLASFVDACYQKRDTLLGR
ncbi:MAG: hypothetical protein KJ709_06420 [Nanoarchaeota archaeon]|nr:hypothetical protein [Nanoarchaeota archaeon]